MLQFTGDGRAHTCEVVFIIIKIIIMKLLKIIYCR